MNINYDKLAIGLLEIIEERGEMGIMSIGMIPQTTFNWFMNHMWKIIAEKITAPGARYESSDAKTIENYLSKEFKQDVEHEMSLALYRNAKMVV